MRLPTIRKGKWVPITHNIAVVGVSGSGKTVFLTSLIHHLKKRSASSKFELKLNSFDNANRPVDIQYLADLERRNVPVDEIIRRDFPSDDPDVSDISSQQGSFSESGTVSSFPYDMHRDEIASKHRWPGKTTDFSRFGCRVNFTLAGKCSARRIWFYDMPGERLADVEIARCRGYEDWSKGMVEVFISHDDFKKNCAADFLQLMHRGNLQADQVLAAYKSMLWKGYRCYMDTISPSVFRLDRGGRSIDWNPSDDQYFLQRRCGLEGKDFAPLTPECIRLNPELAKQFASYYREYRKDIVDPFLRVLGSCDSLVLLVDIVSILNGGLTAFVSAQKLMNQLFDLLSDRAGLMSRLLRTTTLRTNLKNIAVVASKLDLISTSDVQEDGMIRLLKQLMEEPLQKQGMHRMNLQYFQCSAVEAAEVVPDSEDLGAYQLRGYTEESPDRQVPSEPIRRMPKEWDTNWEPGKYEIPNGHNGYLPWPPANPIYPPLQSGTDKVLAFVLEG